MKVGLGILFVLVASLPYVTMLAVRSDGDPRAAERADEELVILSPHRREVRQEYSRGFEDWVRARHGRSVRVLWLDVGGTSKILKELESRYAAAPDRPGADLLFGGGVSPYYRAIERGWLADLGVEPWLLEDIPPFCAGSPVYDPEGRWAGVALSGFGILYNRPLLERVGLPVPETWADLGGPEWMSWLASGDPRSSGSVHMCYEIILQAYGFERGWGVITRICANVRRFGEGGGTVPREVASGDVAAGMVIDQYALTVMDAVGRDALFFALPKDATMIGADAIGVLCGAPNPELARLFVTYCLREEGQRLLYQPAGVNGQRHALHRLPVRRSLYDEPGAPETRPYEVQGRFRYDENKGGRRWRLVNDLIGVQLIDAHAELVRAWEAVIAAGCHPGDVAQLCAPPMGEEELMAMQETWNDSRRRIEAMWEWAMQSRARYEAVAATAVARAGRAHPDG